MNSRTPFAQPIVLADGQHLAAERVNPLEQNVRLYRVEKGIRKLIAKQDQTIDVRQWHRLKVATVGCQIRVFCDDKLIFEYCDRVFTKGTIGLWTKSDAVTYFHDLRLTVYP